VRIRFPYPLRNLAADRRKAGAHSGRPMGKGEAGTEGGADRRQGRGRPPNRGMEITAAGAGVMWNSGGARKEVAIEGNPLSPLITGQFTEGRKEADKVESAPWRAGTEGARI